MSPEIIDAIKHFEPRIGPSSLNVKAMAETEKLGPNMIGFQIEGQLWASPLPEQLYLKTKIDLETGQCVLRHQSRLYSEKYVRNPA